ncbi:MAG: DNA repair protein RecO [Nostocaceae cyanobacterium]|nr:DNA repair protein RecO [Nostocaceae cyanobacterium]
MSKTYKATGINLKTQVFGESDRLVTILTQEHGLIRVIAPGSRKHNSSLGGRSGMFVVNDLLIAKGRSLDRITQAQTVKCYPGLAKDLGKLAASQYLAEIVLFQALSEQPQVELYDLFNEHLSRLEDLPSKQTLGTLVHLTHGVFQLLACAGLTPQVQACCLTQRPLTPDFTNSYWQVGFSTSAGGIVCLQAWENLLLREHRKITPVARESRHTYGTTKYGYKTIEHRQEIPALSSRLNAKQLAILQQLSQPEIIRDITPDYNWLFVEQVLRQYAQYHFGRPIRSATLIDSYFAANHDAKF